VLEDEPSEESYDEPVREDDMLDEESPNELVRPELSELLEDDI
jgi:hypothetical protein